MVANPRKKTGLSRIRPLNQPALIQVQEDERGMPRAVVLRHREVGVTSVQDMWEIVDEWWRTSSITRRYYLVVLDDNKSMTLFRDRLSDLWYEQRP